MLDWVAYDEAAVSTLLSPVLVARDDPMQVLREGLLSGLQGRGGVIALLGEAGIGKSRLPREFAAEARERCTVMPGRAAPGTLAGLRPFADALQPVFRSRRLPVVDELRPFVPALARLVPDWRTGSEVPWLDPLTIGEGLLRLLTVIAGPSAGVLVLEDLHWADAETCAVLEYLVDHLPAAPVLCILTCRTDERTPGSQAVQALIDRRAVQLVSLGRLDEGSAMAMARACLGATN